jgi:hypothetical protein
MVCCGGGGGCTGMNLRNFLLRMVILPEPSTRTNTGQTGGLRQLVRFYPIWLGGHLRVEGVFWHIRSIVQRIANVCYVVLLREQLMCLSSWGGVDIARTIWE